MSLFLETTDTAEFPDAVTSRGTKHLLTLIDAIKKGYKSYLLFLVQIQNMEKVQNS
jgi:sugar fermentation stimulation protein A